MQNKKVEPYSLPLRAEFRNRIRDYFTGAFLIALFIMMIFIPSEGDLILIVSRAILGILSALVIYTWVYPFIKGKPYLEVTEEYIKYKSIYGTKQIAWTQALTAQIYSISNAKMLGIVTKEHHRKRKGTFWAEIHEGQGGNFSIRIPLANFRDIDIDRLYLTVKDKIRKEYEKEPKYTEDISTMDAAEDEIESEGKLGTALLRSIEISIAFGIVYGISIYILNVNFLLIPAIGIVGISYYFNREYKQAHINLLVRLLLGAISSLQIFIAVIVSVIAIGEMPLSLQNINFLLRQYISYTLENPMEEFIFILLAVVSFIYGSLQDYSFKFLYVFKKPFMKRWGRYYIIKESHIINVFITDPVMYDENDKHKLAFNVGEGCYIEKDKKRVRCFYVPRYILDKENIKMDYDSIETIEGTECYKLDLGSNGGYRQYVYPCILVMSSEKHVELVKLEV